MNPIKAAIMIWKLKMHLKLKVHLAQGIFVEVNR